jgi:Holliday junction resolvase RusA-like endonuclease
VNIIVLSGESRSTNHLYKNTCRNGYSTTYLTPEGKALKEQYQWEAKAQWRGPQLEGDISVSVTFYFATKRKRDLDNQNKLMLDALTGIAWEDDSQIAELLLRRGFDSASPRIRIEVSQMTGAHDEA